VLHLLNLTKYSHPHESTTNEGKLFSNLSWCDDPYQFPLVIVM